MQGEKDESIIIIGDFNTPPPEMDRSSRQKSSKDILELNKHHQSNGHNGHLQITSSNNSRIHLLKLIRNIHQNRPHSGPQKNTITNLKK